MINRLVKLLCLSASVAATSACSPTFENLPDDFILEGEGRTPEEAAANMEALRQLVEEGREREARPTLEEELEVHVLTPDQNPALTDTGALTRAALEDFVEQGPHAVLGSVLLEPHYTNGTAVGFEIADLYEGSGFITGAGLGIGDVVTSVNGHSILMPDGFMDAWESLSDAEQLEVGVILDGSEEQLTWQIEAPAGDGGDSAP